MAVVVQADPTFAGFAGPATAHAAGSVLVTAILTPVVTHYLCTKERKAVASGK